MMVGRDVVLQVKKDQHAPGAIMLSVRDLSTKDSRGLAKLKDITFDVRVGEIVGIAGVAGNGQDELVDVLTG